MRRFLDLITVVPQPNLLQELAAAKEGVVPFPGNKRPTSSLAALHGGADVVPLVPAKPNQTSEPIRPTDVVTKSPVIAHWDFERNRWTVTVNGTVLVNAKNQPRYFVSHMAAQTAGQRALSD